MVIERDKVVYLDYILRDKAGTIIEQTEEGESFAYIHGAGQFIPGLERQLEGLNVGDRREIVVPPDEAYGHHDPEGVFSVPRDAFPKDRPLEVGEILMGEGEDGEMVPVRIIDVGLMEVRVDANHPLAGETLHFDVTIKNVRDATEEELAHGHLHDEGHDHDHDHDDDDEQA